MRYCVAAMTTVMLCAWARADNVAAMREYVLALGKLTTAPVVHAIDDATDAPGLRRIYYDALPYKGKPTRVFAWLGVPEQPTAKLPGIVLVHGGGGTAYKEWVQRWNDAGFAAISIAVEGQTDERAEGKTWKRHDWAGPARQGIYADSTEPLTDQWMYHAVSDTVLANSLLRSLAEVDPNKVGLMGTSWGGVIAGTVIGIDTRFAFAIPTYGCGHLYDSDNQYGQALAGNAMYKEVWDPMVRMPRATMPVLWFTWLHDVHFPLTSQSACYRAAPGARMVAVLPDMKHSHPAAWSPPDSYAFALSIVKTGRPWLRQTGQRLEGQKLDVEFESDKTLTAAELWSTTERGFTGSRKWTSTPATLESRNGTVVVHATSPEGTTAYFVNVRSELLTASSDFMEIK